MISFWDGKLSATTSELTPLDCSHHFRRRPDIAALDPHDLAFAIDQRSSETVIDRAGFPFNQDGKTTR